MLKRVVITVKDGVVEALQVPEGVTLSIIDYDNLVNLVCPVCFFYMDGREVCPRCGFYEGMTDQELLRTDEKY